MALDPREALSIKALFDAGAHTKALAMAFGHDQRTIRRTMRQWTRQPIAEPPLPLHWQQGLSPDTLGEMHRYFERLRRHERTILHRLQEVAQATDETLAFPSPSAYDEIIRAAQPHESLVELAQRLTVDLNVVLLAYAEWREQTESLQWVKPPGGQSE